MPGDVRHNPSLGPEPQAGSVHGRNVKTSRTLTVLFSTLGLAGCPAPDDDMSADGSTGSTGAADAPMTGDDDDDDDNDDDDDDDTTSGPPGDDDDDAPGTDSSSDDAGADSPLVEACEDFYTTYDECFPQYAGEGYCDGIDEYVAGDCGDSYADYFACLSELDCATLESTDEFDCRDQYEAAYEVCDGAVAACQAGEGSGDLAFTFCDASLFHCVDDHTYGIDCALDGGTVDCTCTIDDASSGMFSYEDTEALCSGDAVVTAVTESCGWPADVASDLQ